jgi:hypothetical protein
MALLMMLRAVCAITSASVNERMGLTDASIPLCEPLRVAEESSLLSLRIAENSEASDVRFCGISFGPNDEIFMVPSLDGGYYMNFYVYVNSFMGKCKLCLTIYHTNEIQ